MLTAGWSSQLQSLRNGLLCCLPAAARAYLRERSATQQWSAPSRETAPLSRSAVARFWAEQTLPVQKRRRDWAISLPASWVLQREVRFPAQVKGQLAGVLEHELDRLTPFGADQVYFSFRLAGADAQPEYIRVQLVLVPRWLLDASMAAWRQRGLRVGRIDWVGAWPGADLLARSANAGGRGRKWLGRVLDGSLWAAVLLLLLAVLLVPLLQKRAQLEVYQQGMQVAQKKLTVLEQLRARLDSVRGEAEFLQGKKRDAIPMLQVLRDLTLHLPHDAWVQTLELKGDEASLRGEARDAGKLIAILESVPQFSQVDFKSPVVQVPNSDMERYYITLRVQREGAQ